MIGIEVERRYSAHPYLFLQRASGQILKDDVNSFSYTMDICYVVTVQCSHTPSLTPCSVLMKETPRRRIMVTSSVNETSTKHLGNRVGLELRWRGVTPPAPTSFYSGLLDSSWKTTLSVSPPPWTFVIYSHTPSLSL